MVECHLKPELGATRLRAFGVRDVDRFYSRLAKAGAKGGRPLSPASVRRIHAILHAAVEHAVRQELLEQPGAVLRYYASRGETPLVWDGSGAARLGLHRS
jgi:hypothetical protein